MLSVICSIITAAIAAGASLAVAMIERKSSRRQKQAESRNERREQESRLSMKLMNATCSLSVVTARKVAGEETNGDLERAVTEAKAAQKAYNDFVADTAARQFSKM